MSQLNVLQHVWYGLIGVLLAGYSVLDGFDLGIAILHPVLARNDEERKTLLRIIGPVWDGNEVWLLAGGGALFAAFPLAYATVFSGFYLALMALLVGLIFRAVSLEFWHHDLPRRRFWSGALWTGSLLPALLLGVALGNLIQGVPLDSRGEFYGNFFTLLRPYPLAVGVLGLFVILLQGSAYAALKTTGFLQERARRCLRFSRLGVFAFSVFTAILALAYLNNIIKNSFAWAVCLFIFGVQAAMLRLRRRATDRWFFLCSSLLILLFWLLVGTVLYPNLVRASNNPALSLTLFNASSSALTLKIMLAIALLGMPLVILYSLYAYRVFRGKILLEEK